MNTDYIIAFAAAIFYVLITNDSVLSSLPAVIGQTLAALLVPLVIAGIIKIFASTKFSKIYMWTTVVVLTASALGNSL